MPADSLDKFPSMGICVSCGQEIMYSPIRMPLGPPIINPERPAHYVIERADMCVQCIRDQLDTLQKKVLAGEMYPTKVWDTDSEDNFIIVSISDDSYVGFEPEETKPTGVIRRVITAIWQRIW